MDLGAYAQIESLEQIMKDNGIGVPRLRGLRLMGNEVPVSDEELEKKMAQNDVYLVEDLCRCGFRINSNTFCYSSDTDKVCKKYIEYSCEDGFKFPSRIRWERLHGKKRKAAKYEIKRRRRAAKEQYALWNKYCGHDDVLYIHARLGGSNWGSYDCNKIVSGQPWYLDHVEDESDLTYVDIYARIGKEKAE